MEDFLLIGLLPIAIYGALAVRTFGILGIALAMLIVGTVFGHSFFHVSVITLDRLLLGVLVGAITIFRIHGKIEGERWNMIDVLIASWIGWLTLNTFLHDWKSNKYESVSVLLFFYLIPTCCYIIGRYLRPNASQIRWIMLSFAVLGVYLSITAAAERFGLYFVVFPRYIVNAAYTEFLGRGRGPLLNPSGNGILITLGMVCALLLAKDLQRYNRLAVAAVLIIFSLGIYSTLTRCVWLGGLAALAIVFWAYGPPKLKWTGLIYGIVVAVFVVPVAYPYLTKFKRDKNVSAEDMAESAKLRPMLAIIGWKIAQDHPLTGVGLGHYLEYSMDYAQDREIDIPLQRAAKYVQHNVFLSMLTENGAIGLSLFLLLLTKLCFFARQVWCYPFVMREGRYLVIIFFGFLAAYFCNGMFQDVLIIPMINCFLLFLIGLLRSLNHSLGGQSIAVTTELQKNHYLPSTTVALRAP
ncbi:MAG: hypothetical protein RLY14_3301 [Planctomycetota bacterium]|jgi:O-antigen ligase